MFLSDLQRQPGRHPALQDATRRLTYGELCQHVAAEQAWLTRHGVQRCALLADNGCGWAIADLALLQADAVNVPLPPYFTAAQRQHALEDAGVAWILTDRPDMLGEHDCELIAQSVHSGLSLLHRAPRSVPPVPAHTLKVTYTSGSTADPKGVCLSRAALDGVSTSLCAALGELGIARHMCLLPLATLLENIAGIYVPLLLGIESVLQPLASLGMSYGALDARRLLAAVSATEPNSLVLVPELLRLLVEATQQGWRVPASLKFIAVGGASVPLDLLERAASHGLPVFEGYGLSECASVVCLNLPSACRPGTVGRPLPHARVRVAANGELHVAGAVMSGYLGEPAGTAERSLNDSAIAAENFHDSPLSGEIPTGDLAEIDADGFVRIRGRVKNLFITSMGRNLSPEWLELELRREPAIGQAMVYGEARPFVSALLSPVAAHVTHADLQAAVQRTNARLPEHAQVRRWTLFPEAPAAHNGLLTANGRLRRGAILERCGTHLAALYCEDSNPWHSTKS